MPRPLDPNLRSALVDAAARVLAGEGRPALTTRRLATEVGASTMAVYTYFGGMDDLVRAVRTEGFARLWAGLDAVPPTADPVADLVAAGAAYVRTGLANPHLYRVMFLDPPVTDGAAAAGQPAFDRLVGAVRRCVDAGRFAAADDRGLLGWAVQLWTMRHGIVSLGIAGLLPLEHVAPILGDMSARLFVGYGDDPAAARDSVAAGSPSP